jgi:agmatine deiminase
MASRGDPATLGYRMPAEFDRHDACYISWPCKSATWLGFEAEVKRAYTEVAHAIARFEPVVMLTPNRLVSEARQHLGTGVRIEEMELDDSWVRDNGPNFVRGREGRLAVVQFGFNSWGNKFGPYDRDAEVPRLLADRMGLPCFRAPIVAEGGAINVDGTGTLLTTESCLMNPNRNPGRSKEEVEDALKAFLGVSKVIWLRRGMLESQVDGHIDGIAAFVRPGTVLSATITDPADPDFEIFRANRETLQSATDARGRPIEVVDLPFPRHRRHEGRSIPASHMNFYLANGGVVAPTFGEDSDQAALDVLQRAFPNREVVGVRCEFIALGGGEIHCITQQLPTATPS